MRNRIIAGIVLTVAILVFIGVYWGLESGRQAGAQQLQFNQELELGAKTFVVQCSECHGANGEGFQGPALNGTDLQRDILTKIVERGLPHTIMPAWSVNDGGPLQPREIQEMVDFIYNWNDEILAEARAELGAEEAMGEGGEFASLGEALFNTMGCAECHADNALGTVFKYSPACSSCHTGETRSLVYGPALPGHSDDAITNHVREGGEKMPSFTEDQISDADLQTIIAFLESLPVPEITGDLKALLEDALAALNDEQISLAEEKLDAALAEAELDVQKAEIEKIIDDVEHENHTEAAELIESLLIGEDGHDHMAE